MADQIRWDIDPADLQLHERAASACGRWDCVRVHNGWLYSRWGSGSSTTAGEWKDWASAVVTTTFVPLVLAVP